MDTAGRSPRGWHRSGFFYSDSEEGSLIIYIQYDYSKGKESNWLPAPNAEFYLINRLYWPEDDVNEGKLKPLPVEGVE